MIYDRRQHGSRVLGGGFISGASGMMKFDHLNLPVSNLERSRDWWVSALGLKVEFEVPDTPHRGAERRRGLRDLPAGEAGRRINGVALWFQVDDVDATHAEWSARGVRFNHGPQKNFWGYGPELADPDGYLVRLWDEKSMKEK